MQETTKLAIGAGVGLLAVVGIAYAVSSNASTTAATPAAGAATIPPIGGGTVNQMPTITPIGGGTTNQSAPATGAGGSGTTAAQLLNPNASGVVNNLLPG